MPARREEPDQERGRRPAAPVFAAAGDGPRVIVNPIQRDHVTFVTTARESGGAFTRMETLLAAGGGNPPHRHRRHSEWFTCVEGEVAITLGRHAVALAPGQSATAAPGVRHRFHNPTAAPCRFLVEVKPGDPDFEDALRMVYGLARDGRTNRLGMPRRPDHAIAVTTLGDVVPAGPGAVAFPLLRLLARTPPVRRARAQLRRLYCGAVSAP